MKKMFIWMLLMACLLAGCARQKAPQETQTPPPKEIERAEAPEVAEDPALRDKAVETYRTITGGETFSVIVEKLKEDYTALDITPDTAWNVKNRELVLESDYRWLPATQKEWESQMAAEKGYVLTLCAPEGTAAIQCCQSGDIVSWQLDGEGFYARAVNPREGELFEGKLYDALVKLAQDAMSAQVWDVVADGSITDLNAAAADLCVQIAENYRNVPDWVSWKPVDVQPGNVKVFDVYRGQPEQFCANMGFWVQLEDPTSVDAGYWQAGAGLMEQGTGSLKDHWSWDLEVHVVKNANGDWYCSDRGTGGYSVILPESGKDGPSLEGLVDAFYLTEGFTHDWLIPYHILERLPEQLTELPVLLEVRTEEQQLAMQEALVELLNGENKEMFSHWTEEALLKLLEHEADA